MNRDLRRLVVHGVLVLQMAAGVTYTLVWAYRTGSLPLTAAGSFVAWSGVLLAHRLETGRFVDPPGSPGTTELRYRFLVPGVLLMVAAFPVASLGIHLDSALTILAGEIMFFTGFPIAHYGIRGNFY